MNKELTEKFNSIDNALSQNLSKVIEEVLQKSKGEKIYSIGFVTTDDFYGAYVVFDFVKDGKAQNINQYFEWTNAVYPSFLYDSLVDVVDNLDIDLTKKSEEKWIFAKVLMTTISKNLHKLPDSIFTKHNYKKDDILFFITMSDGDYISEMLMESAKLFNQENTLRCYNLLKQF